MPDGFAGKYHTKNIPVHKWSFYNLVESNCSIMTLGHEKQQPLSLFEHTCESLSFLAKEF